MIKSFLFHPNCKVKIIAFLLMFFRIRFEHALNIVFFVNNYNHIRFIIINLKFDF
jgi:hypothetical protein